MQAAETAGPHPGEVIYQKLCTECHGKDGQEKGARKDTPAGVKGRSHGQKRGLG